MSSVKKEEKEVKMRRNLKKLSRPMLSPFRTNTCKYFLRDSFRVIHVDAGPQTDLNALSASSSRSNSTNGQALHVTGHLPPDSALCTVDHEYGRPANAHGVSTSWPGNLTPPAPIDEHEFPTTLRRADPGSPLLQQAREESDARASVHHSEREGTHRSRYLSAPGHPEQDVEVRANNMSGHGSLKGKTSRR